MRQANELQFQKLIHGNLDNVELLGTTRYIAYVKSINQWVYIIGWI